MSNNAEGYVWTTEQRKKLSTASLAREATIRRKVSIGGVVYDNATRASIATGISTRSIFRYANGIGTVKPRHISMAMFELCKTIRYVEMGKLDDAVH